MRLFPNPRKLRIRTRLVLVYSTLIFVSILTVSILLIAFSRQAIVRLAVHYSSGILEQMGENIDINLNQIDLASYLIFPNSDVLRVLKYGPDSLADRTNIETLLVNVMFTRRDIDSIYLFDNAGHRYGTTYTYSYLPYEKLLQAAQSGDGRLVWIKSPSSPDIIQAVRLVRTMTMEKVGLLLINVRTNSISSVISERLSDMNGSVLIVDGDGGEIAGIRAQDTGYLPSEEAMGRIRAELEARQKGAGYYSLHLEGAERIVTYYPSRFIDDWTYITLIPVSELTHDVTRLLRIGIAVSLAISGFFMLLTYFVAGGIVNPIKDIAYRMRRVEIQSGVPDSRYASEDEIGYLNKSFRVLLERVNTLIKEVYEQKLLRREQELKTLQAQINPHFLYNTLDTVNWIAISRRVPEIGEIVRALSGILRYSINNEHELVPLDEELKHVRRYCLIQAIRLDGRLQAEYRIDEELLDYEIPKLVLQPIVENAILHGFKGKSGVCEIVVSGRIRQDAVCLRVEDNGVGMDESALRASGTGIGLRNVDRRLKLKYGEAYGVTVRSETGKGTAVTIELPI